MSDIFKRLPVDVRQPITADMALVEWGGILATATQLTINYQQGVTMRRTLGTNGKNTAVIYPTQPAGQISIARLVADSTENIFDRPGWNTCDGVTTITVSLTGQPTHVDCKSKGGIYTCYGCIATNYSVSAEAEGLTVVDGITISFLQMSYDPPS